MKHGMQSGKVAINNTNNDDANKKKTKPSCTSLDDRSRKVFIYPISHAAGNSATRKYTMTQIRIASLSQRHSRFSSYNNKVICNFNYFRSCGSNYCASCCCSAVKEVNYLLNLYNKRYNEIEALNWIKFGRNSSLHA